MEKLPQSKFLLMNITTDSMEKRVFFYFFFTASFYMGLFFCDSAIAQSQTELPKLKSVVFREFFYQNGKQTLRKQELQEYDFNQELTKELFYIVDSLGIPGKGRQMLCEYNEYGDKITQSTFDEKNVMRTKEEFYYDSKRLLIRSEKTVFLKDNKTDKSRTNFEYDTYGNLAKISYYNNFQRLTAMESIKFNEHREIEAKTQTEYAYVKNDVKKKIISINFKYDKNGNMLTSTVETIGFDGQKVKESNQFKDNFLYEAAKYKNEKLVSRFVRDDIKIGNGLKEGLEPPIPTQDELMDNLGYSTEWKVNNKYDELDRLVKSEKFVDNEVVSTFLYLYNNEGQLERVEKRYKEKKGEETTAYTYDVYGNILSELVVLDGVPKLKITYEYEYY